VGWDLSLIGLTLHVADPGRDKTEEGMTWVGSPDGIDFMKRSSEAWGEATLASAVDDEWARAAAQRTLEAYTGAGN
jgi:hypothetical protein